MSNRIDLTGDSYRKEALAAAAITPGMLTERTSAGKFQKHSTAGGNAMPMFALLDMLQGKDKDDDYAADARVTAGVFGPGQEVQAIIQDGQDISDGDFLESAGDGTLRALASGVAICQALEAKDASDSATTALSERRIDCMVL